MIEFTTIVTYSTSI